MPANTTKYALNPGVICFYSVANEVVAKSKKKQLRVAVLCGGPSSERGISLNSARSVCDHLEGDDLEVVPFYFDLALHPYKLSRAQIYSNTPSDFDFKLRQIGGDLKPQQLVKELKAVDLVFPAIHGRFGEDGTLQSFLEKHQIPFVGSGSEACQSCFDKHLANESLKELGFYSLPSLLLERKAGGAAAKIKKFFAEQKIKRGIVKPAIGGSSIGVYSVTSPQQALDRVQHLFASGMHHRVVVEPFCEGVEFTSILLENRFGLPVCLLPVEIQADYFNNQIFDYRKKYLPTRQVSYHCPARFGSHILDRIYTQAEALFKHFELHDFARFDGWLLKDGQIYFSDFNPISGMEQNSFLFMQASRIGMTHRDVLRFVINRACQRLGIDWHCEQDNTKKKNKKTVAVLFGGSTAERQVSLMSGTNVWLKLRASKHVEPEPYFLDPHDRVWKLPYGYALNHTIEEIQENCERASELEQMLIPLRKRVHERLFLPEGGASITHFQPEMMTLAEFLNRAEYVFLGLHGGIGENGVIQAMLKKRGAHFNGSGPEAARTCMDKAETGEIVERAKIAGVHVPKKLSLSTAQLAKTVGSDFDSLWDTLRMRLPGGSIIVKPQDDGCSAGVARLFDVDDLRRYVKALLAGEISLPPNTIQGQANPIEMPTSLPSHLLFEEFIDSDKIEVDGGSLRWHPKSGWVEVTVAVMGKKGKLHALNPSVTIAAGNVLSLEEKFQGGTGINITPPPPEFVSPKVVALVRKRIEAVGNALGIENYARIDAFMHINTGELYIIEANTLPALTPSTVLYHQALAEKPAIYPRELLEKFIEMSS